MALSNSTLNLLRTQYYDDFYAASDTDPTVSRGDDFDFQRILFRPKMPVQSRELTQIQTIIQSQLERFGKSAFRDGEAVVGGGITLDLGVTSGEVLPTTNLVAFFDRTTNDGKYIFDANNTTSRAHVLQFLGADEGASANYLIFKYQSAGEFEPSTVVQATDDATVTATFASGSDVFSTASIASIDEGVYFISGFFVRVRKQSIVLNPFSARPSYRIGLEISEEVLDELDDVVGETLLDPANNEAPGAHRLRIRLTLTKKSIGTSANPAFIELLRVIDGEIQHIKPVPRFVRIDELNDILARRTNDESGDYLVRPFTPIIEDDPESDETFLLSLGPGKAYVRGYEVETAEPSKLVVRKGRETETAENRSIATSLGNYVYTIRTAADQPLTYFSNTGEVDLHCVNTSSILTTNTATYAYSKIGTAKVRAIETHTVPANTALFANNSVHRLYFFDARFDSITGNVSSAVQNGSSIEVRLPVGNGVPIVANALNGVTVLLSGASSPVSGTFTVQSYAANSTVGIATLAEFLPTLPNGNTTFRLLFQTKDADAFADYDAAVTQNAPFSTKLAFQAEVDILSKRSGTPAGETFVSDSNRSGLVYQVPERFVKPDTLTAETATFTSWVKTTTNAIAVTGNTNFTLSITGANYSLPTGNLTASDARQYLVVFDQTADGDGRGRTLQFTDTPGSTTSLGNVSVTAVGTTYNITFTLYNPSAATRSLVGYARTTVIGLEPRQKTLIVGNTTHAMANTSTAQQSGQIEFHTLNATAGFSYSLKTPDVFRISKVLYKADGTPFANTDMSTATDVTDYFTLDTGQRDGTYEYANLIAGATASRVVRPTGRLLVIFDWFEHSGRGYATVDSYLSSLNLDRGMTYDDIPDFTSRGGRTINLRDVLDFRPVRSYTEGIALVYAANDTTGLTPYLTTAGESFLIPVSGEEWLGSYEYYLSRIDKIALGYDGQFRVIEGKDAVTPDAPEDEAGALLLFQLTIPPYTLVDDDGIPTGVNLTTFDHKRYTMQDLSKVEDRVARLEYYTALNSLERITRDEAVLDASGNERFKNGILVDSFHGGDVGDVARPDFTASIDGQNRELRNAFRTFTAGFAPDLGHSTTTGVSLVGDMAIPSYTTESFISQPLASHAVSVNPFDVASFYGKIELVPAVDTWKDVDSLPAQVIDLGGPSEAWVNANNPSFTNWGEWDQTWSGVTSRTPRQIMTPNWRVGAIEVESWDDVETQTIFERQGTTFEYNVTTVNASLGNRVVDVSIVHHMRARDMVFSAEGLKPQSNLYAFFDGVNVDGLVQQANMLRLSPQLASAATPFFIGQTLYVRKAVTGTVSITNGSATVTGSGTVFTFELVANQLVRIVQGLTTVDARVSVVGSNTAVTLTGTVSSTLSGATLYTLTPVTVAGVAPRYTGANVEFTLSVVRGRLDADADAVVPYTIVAGSLRPEKHVNDAGNTTFGAAVIIPPSAKVLALTGGTYESTINVESAVCKSGVVRAWNGATGGVRLDTDITDAAVVIGAKLRIVAGAGQGNDGTITAYNAATQTATIDNLTIGIVNESSIYSIGQAAADGLIDASVIAGRAGSFAGVFHLPGGMFATGSRQFRLTDSANNNVDTATTAAEANYEASGLSYTMQETSVSSRQLGLQRGSPRTENISFTAASRDNFDIQYIDPLAETFLVDAKKHPQGVFITSVDICFAGKPTDDIPVTLEIRSVVNGYPSSSQIVPCVAPIGVAACTLRPDQVTTTTAPSFGPSSPTHTRFNFAAPVHLLPGREYAIVVRSDSNAYTIYTAQLGQTVIGSTSVIAKQPYAGSFFKSQNASTWTESPFEDMMFRINRAVWTATEAAPNTAILIARAVAPTVNTTFDSIEFYPHDAHFSGATSATYTLDIKPFNTVTGDLTDSVAVRYAMAPNVWRPLTSRGMLQGSAVNGLLPLDRSYALPAANTVDAILTLTTNSRDVAPFIDLKKINMLCVQHLLDDMGLRDSGVMIASPGAGYLVTSQTGLLTITSGSPNVTGDANTSFLTSVTAGDTIIIGGNVEMIVSSVTNSSHLVATTNATVSRAANTFHTYGTLAANNALAVSIDGGNGNNAAAYALIGRDGKIADIVMTANGGGYTGTPTVSIAAPAAVAGVTVTQSTGSLTYHSELASSGGNALTRYMTRPVTLADDFDARDLVVMFDAVRPTGTHVYVYYKVLPGNDATVRFEDQPWRLMDMETPDSTVSANYYQFKEFKYVTPNRRALDASTDTTDRFKTFAVKVVMASDNPVNAPRIANFRAMALDT